MLFLQLFYTFLIIGAFTFGGGYSMIALIESEVVTHHHWMTATEFADMLAVSQITPGPIGINTATYAGYTAVINAGYPQWAAVCGSLLASISAIIIPVALVVVVGRWLLKHNDNPQVATVMRILRLTVIGLIAAAAIGLVPTAFGDQTTQLATNYWPLVVSIIIFLTVFLLAFFRKASPIVLILASGFVGLVVYSI